MSPNIKSFALKNNLSGEHRLKNQGKLPTLVGALTLEAHPIGYAVWVGSSYKNKKND